MSHTRTYRTPLHTTVASCTVLCSVDIDDVASVHFTQYCPKPWMCAAVRKPGCRALTDKWYNYRAQLMAAKGLTPTAACSGRTYVPITAAAAAAAAV
jgi:hypothetical protein